MVLLLVLVLVSLVLVLVLVLNGYTLDMIPQLAALEPLRQQARREKVESRAIFISHERNVTV